MSRKGSLIALALAFSAAATGQARPQNNWHQARTRLYGTSPRPVSAPWARRFRVGVKVLPPVAQLLQLRDLRELGIGPQDLRELGIHPRELRQLGLQPRGQGLLDLGRWPEEPATPAKVDHARLGQALRQICPVLVPPGRAAQYARWIVEHSNQFDVDPMLVAALVYQQGRCWSHRWNTFGSGLAMISLFMHRRWIQHGRYTYWVLKDGRWASRQQRMDHCRFDRQSLLDPRCNIYFTAGIMAVLREQCPAIDGLFRSVSHRHFVSHFIYGDRVREAGPEDLVLRARRRLLEYYGSLPPRRCGRINRQLLVCPLDGAPLKITSSFGDQREGGKRRHNGVDFASDFGEPVRAIAPGTVVLAGVDAGQGGLRNLDPRLTGLVPPSRMGPRGVLVKVQHDAHLVSEYMHLSAQVVHVGQRVSSGELLGYVGRTGMKESDAHLHFGLLQDGRHLDPFPLLKEGTFPVEATLAGRADQQRGQALPGSVVRPYP